MVRIVCLLRVMRDLAGWMNRRLEEIQHVPHKTGRSEILWRMALRGQARRAVSESREGELCQRVGRRTVIEKLRRGLRKIGKTDLR